MKSEKGVTLTSLVVYIMLVLIILGILAVITASFQSNIKEINKEGSQNVEIDKFNMYFLKDAKKQGNEIKKISKDEIEFTMGNKYTFKDEAIYLNDNIKIAEDIEKCSFSNKLDNGKTIINVAIKVKDSKEQNIEYVLSNETDNPYYEKESDYTEGSSTPIGYIEKLGTKFIDIGIYQSNTTETV